MFFFFFPCMVMLMVMVMVMLMLTHLPSFWLHSAGWILMRLYIPPCKIVPRILVSTQSTWSFLFVRYGNHLKDLQYVTVLTLKKTKTCVVTPWRLVLLKCISYFTIRIISAQDKARHTTCRHLIWHTMRHCNKTLRDIWHDLLYRTCSDRQCVQKKHTQVILNIIVDVLTSRSVQIKDKGQKLWQRIDLW